MFAAPDGLLWGATRRAAGEEAAIVFTCITDSRRPVRAIAVDAIFRLPDASDDDLRNWLGDAPAVGKLT